MLHHRGETQQFKEKDVEQYQNYPPPPLPSTHVPLPIATPFSFSLLPYAQAAHQDLKALS